MLPLMWAWPSGVRHEMRGGLGVVSFKKGMSKRVYGEAMAAALGETKVVSGINLLTRPVPLPAAMLAPRSDGSEERPTSIRSGWRPPTSRR